MAVPIYPVHPLAHSPVVASLTTIGDATLEQIISQKHGLFLRVNYEMISLEENGERIQELIARCCGVGKENVYMLRATGSTHYVYVDSREICMYDCTMSVYPMISILKLTRPVVVHHTGLTLRATFPSHTTPTWLVDAVKIDHANLPTSNNMAVKFDSEREISIWQAYNNILEFKVGMIDRICLVTPLEKGAPYTYVVSMANPVDTTEVYNRLKEKAGTSAVTIVST